MSPISRVGYLEFYLIQVGVSSIVRDSHVAKAGIVEDIGQGRDGERH